MKWFAGPSTTHFSRPQRTNSRMHPVAKRLSLAFLYAFLLVAVLSVLGLFASLFHYPLFPGIYLAGNIFSAGVESDHRLRFEVAAVIFNTILYGLAIYFIFMLPGSRATRRRRSNGERRHRDPYQPR